MIRLTTRLDNLKTFYKGNLSMDSKHFVEFEVETEDKYDTIWYVGADINVIKDPYATGDSPTQYEVNITRVSNRLCDEDLSAFDEATMNYLEEMAIDSFLAESEIV